MAARTSDVDEGLDDRDTIATLRNGDPVGAWLFKANPAVWDIGAYLRSGAPLDRWRMAPSYRVDLVEPGQPCALWVTNGDPRLPPGIWAVGEIANFPFEDVGDPTDELWRDRGDARHVRPYVDLVMDVLADGVPRDVIRADPRLADMEIFRAPRVASPVAVGPGEWRALSELIERG